MNAVSSEKQLLAFIDARGGCGKTFLLNSILSGVRGSSPGGCVALAMATTGIAANPLELERTFHSRLKATLTPTEDSTLQVTQTCSLVGKAFCWQAIFANACQLFQVPIEQQQ